MILLYALLVPSFNEGITSTCSLSNMHVKQDCMMDGCFGAARTKGKIHTGERKLLPGKHGNYMHTTQCTCQWRYVFSANLGTGGACPEIVLPSFPE